MKGNELGILWTVCSNLETLILQPGDYPESFYTNLRQAFDILRREYTNISTAGTFAGEGGSTCNSQQ